MIGQGIGLKHLLPMAVEELKKNPLAEGDYYEGDLLIQVLGRDQSELGDNAQAISDLIAICEAALIWDEPSLSDEKVPIVREFIGRY